MRCTYLGCTTKPVNEIRPAYGAPWLGCKEHTPAMAKALAVGQPTSADVTTRPIRTRRTTA